MHSSGSTWENLLGEYVLFFFKSFVVGAETVALAFFPSAPCPLLSFASFVPPFENAFCGARSVKQRPARFKYRVLPRAERSIPSLPNKTLLFCASLSQIQTTLSSPFL